MDPSADRKVVSVGRLARVGERGRHSRNLGSRERLKANYLVACFFFGFVLLWHIASGSDRDAPLDETPVRVDPSTPLTTREIL